MSVNEHQQGRPTSIGGHTQGGAVTALGTKQHKTGAVRYAVYKCTPAHNTRGP